MLNNRLVAHRGYQKLYPENSRLSLSKAIETGGLHVETDVMFTRDKKAVLFHDLVMTRLSGIDDGIHHKDWDELKTLSAYEPERLGDKFNNTTIEPLSYLVELAKQNPQVTIYVELKPAGIHYVGSKKALQICQQELAEVRDQCVLMSYHYDIIKHARKNGWPKVGIVLKDWDDLHSAKIHNIQPDYIFASHAQLPKIGYIDLTTKNLANSILVIYEVADPDYAAELFERGVDMIETFDIEGMLTSLAHKAL
jgi:glycerophosphoryl diester phosphodiesterase